MKNSSLTGTDIKNSSLTGGDVKNGSLGATMSLQPGKCFITAHMDMDDISGSGKIVTCELRAGGTLIDDEFLKLDGSSGGTPCYTDGVRDIAAATNVTFGIDTPAGSQVRAGDVRLTAIRVETLASTAVTG